MFGTLKTLIAGANARAEDQVRDTFCIELIDQKIREADASLKAAKFSLASLIQRERGEVRQIEALEGKISDLMNRAAQAFEAGREELATEAAQAIATMENECEMRRDTLNRLQTRVLQLRQSVETANRRIIDLKQGAIAARSAKKEQECQRRLGPHVAQETAFEEAEVLISRVLKKDDPFEQGQILKEIDRGLDQSSVAERMADAGFGPNLRSTASDVLQRIKAQA